MAEVTPSIEPPIGRRCAVSQSGYAQLLASETVVPERMPFAKGRHETYEQAPSSTRSSKAGHLSQRSRSMSAPSIGHVTRPASTTLRVVPGVRWFLAWNIAVLPRQRLRGHYLRECTPNRAGSPMCNVHPERRPGPACRTQESHQPESECGRTDRRWLSSPPTKGKCGGRSR